MSKMLQKIHCKNMILSISHVNMIFKVILIKCKFTMT